MLLMMDFAETLEDKWNTLGLRKSQFECRYNSPISTGQIVIHQTGNFTAGTLFNIFCVLYVDDGVFVF